jgi:hypothetical protein
MEGPIDGFLNWQNQSQEAVSVKEEQEDSYDLDEIMMRAKSTLPPHTPQQSTGRYTPFPLKSRIVLDDHILEVDGVFPLPGTRAHAWLMTEAERVLPAPWN